jgi:hypothetical protein
VTELESGTNHPAKGNAVARDLWWAASSPPLMTNVARLPQLSHSRRVALQEKILPAVHRLEAMNLEAAMATVDAQEWRVGYYFEALVAHWLQHLSGWQLLATNHPVRQDKRTLGAYDFIVRNANGQAEHWEVAVKFYLRREESPEWHNWVGPNQRDSLDKKVNRMRDHQLVLSRRDVGQAVLHELGVAHIHHQVALLKGYFFTEWGTSSAGPMGSTSDAEGRWADAHRLPELAHAFPESRWVHREKPFWLAPLHQVQLESETGRLPEDVQRPEMWARMKRAPNGSWDEAERWFLVPRDWRDGR